MIQCISIYKSIYKREKLTSRDMMQERKMCATQDIAGLLLGLYIKTNFFCMFVTTIFNSGKERSTCKDRLSLQSSVEVSGKRIQQSKTKKMRV